MTPIFVFLIAAVTATAADKYPDLLADMTKRPWPGENYPTLPSLSPSVRNGAGNEMTHSPAVRQAIAGLNPKNDNGKWSASVAVLEHEHAVWCLQACLCHPDEDVQIIALRALGRLKEPKSVPFLLIYAEYEAVYVPGSEGATIHGIIQEEIAVTLSALTGIVVQIKGQDPEGLIKGIHEWRKWLVEHPIYEIQEGTPHRRITQNSISPALPIEGAKEALSVFIHGGAINQESG